ncbi:MAG: S24 family peptidase [Rhodospirillaceae bacterium]|nr:S24 family peptidase [Rhodospirillaceae bacterium]
MGDAMAKQRTAFEDLDVPRRVILSRLEDESMQGATLKSLSLALGRNETYLHQFVWYSSPQKLDEDDRVKLAALLKVDQQTLRAPGHLGNTPDLPPDFHQQNGTNPPHKPALGGVQTSIVELAIRASSGGGSVVSEEPELGSWSFPELWLRTELRASVSELRIITIDGDSMEGVLRSGDKVIVHIGRTEPSPPGVFILFDGIGLVAKRLEFMEGSDPPSVRISSSNPSYPPYERTVDEINIIGRIVGRWERL